MRGPHRCRHREDRVAGCGRPELPAPDGNAGARGRLGRVRAWMLVLPVDGALLSAPLSWETGQVKAVMAVPSRPDSARTLRH
ncbi:hypothetical protein ACVGVM_12670 [Pseudonocardia bannensis]